MKVAAPLSAPVERPSRLRGAVPIVLALVGLAACTGRVPGTGVPSTVPPGVVYETARARESPPPAPSDPSWLDSPPPAAPAAPAPYVPPSAPPRPATHVAAPPAPAPSSYGYGPSSTRRDSAGGDSSGRERQIAILTEAVTALREEIARGYAHSQELLEETKRLRIQVRTLREDLEKSQNANATLRAQVRTLERRLGEIRVSPPVQ